MLLFSIFHVFFSHQHVQMSTGPHEKKLCGKIFWVPFLNKSYFFKNYSLRWIFKIESWDFAYVIFSYRSTFSALPVVENRKKLIFGPPYYMTGHTLMFSSNDDISQFLKQPSISSLKFPMSMLINDLIEVSQC